MARAVCVPVCHRLTQTTLDGVEVLLAVRLACVVVWQSEVVVTPLLLLFRSPSSEVHLEVSCVVVRVEAGLPVHGADARARKRAIQ